MTIRKGDIVSRDYSNHNITAGREYTVLEVKKTGIKIRADTGLSSWYNPQTWTLIRTDWEEIVRWVIVWTHPDLGFAAQTTIYDDERSAALRIRTWEDQVGPYIILAKKKIVIPYKRVQPQEAAAQE